jgi:DNA-binding CsgD family transcriptional regulator/PAS domain-containing protein
MSIHSEKDANARQFSLLEDIYDTTFNPALWDTTLHRIVEHTDTRTSGLVAKDASGAIRVAHHSGVSDRFVRNYLDTYGQFDPTHSIRLFDTGDIHSTEDWVPIDEFRRSEFYNGWARPQGLEDVASVLLDKSADGFSYFCLTNGTLVGDDLRRKIAPLVPHLRRAVLIGQQLHGHAPKTQFESALDALKAGVFLLDGTGAITHANASAQELVERRDFLRSERGRLVAIDLRLNAMLRDGLTASILGDGMAQSRSAALHFVAHNGERFVGHLLSLNAGRRRETGRTHDAVAVLFVSKAALDTALAPDIIKKVFKLTPAELRVMLTIVEFGCVSDSAKSLDVAETTVKTHLRRIFTKTDTKRQADLVKLVAAFSSPARG